MLKVQSIHKVSVSICLTSDTVRGFRAEPVRFSFIYGLGRDGLSPFECCLEGQGVEDHIEFTIKGSDIVESFGVLFPFIRGVIDGMIRPEVLTFDVDILGVEEVDDSEVVAALALSVAGCGC